MFGEKGCTMSTVLILKENYTCQWRQIVARQSFNDLRWFGSCFVSYRVSRVNPVAQNFHKRKKKLTCNLILSVLQNWSGGVTVEFKWGVFWCNIQQIIPSKMSISGIWIWKCFIPKRGALKDWLILNLLVTVTWCDRATRCNQVFLKQKEKQAGAEYHVQCNSKHSCRFLIVFLTQLLTNWDKQLGDVFYFAGTLMYFECTFSVLGRGSVLIYIKMLKKRKKRSLAVENAIIHSNI